MKKIQNPKKLSLGAERIRALTTIEIGRAAGGFITSYETCDSQVKTDCFSRCGGATC